MAKGAEQQAELVGLSAESGIHSMQQASTALEATWCMASWPGARIGFQQLRQGDTVPVIASHFATTLVATLQHPDLCAAWRQ